MLLAEEAPAVKSLRGVSAGVRLVAAGRSAGPRAAERSPTERQSHPAKVVMVTRCAEAVGIFRMFTSEA